MKKTISLILVLTMMVSLTTGVAKAKLVACIGSSQTTGWGLFDPAYNCYPAQLERLLRHFDAHWETRGFGVGGATVLRRGDKPYVSQGAYHQALASEPDVVIFHFGPNASRSPNRQYIQTDFVSDYASLIDDFAQLPSQPDIWICIPTAMLVSGYTISPEIMREQINPLIVEVAHEKGIPVIDLYTPFEGKPELYQADQVHLNTEGAKLMAEIIAACIVGMRTIPDFNGDGVVDCADMCIMVDHWGTDDSLCDIVPPPFGDGIVDVQDLIALAEYLFEDVNDPTLIAHWPLDEAQGAVAYDSASDCDGTLVGDPVWQPTSGMVAGALQFDGIDDYVSIDPVLDPADRKFSVIAWIKGGVPGQAILSQTDGDNWLCSDSVEGCLMTKLKGSGRPSSGPLLSETKITDGTWHRIGLVWDGSYRRLYVDGAEVAQDAAPLSGLEDAYGGLYFGADSALSPDTFFSGLIDDVRIYNRAVQP